MNAKLRAHLTYANVVSTLCLFVLLGGSAYAAAKITGKNVKNGSLTGTDLKNNSVTGKDVKSLGASDFKTGALPTGATGPRGATGLRGPQGPGVGPTEATHFIQGSGAAPDCATASPTGVFCHNDTQPVGTSSNAGAPAALVGYFKDRSGVVHLQGTVAVNCSGISCTGVTTTMFILPPGYRPSGGERYFFVNPSTAPDAQIDVRPDGRVKSTPGNVPLDGISFRP